MNQPTDTPANIHKNTHTRKEDRRDRTTGRCLGACATLTQICDMHTHITVCVYIALFMRKSEMVIVCVYVLFCILCLCFSVMTTVR